MKRINVLLVAVVATFVIGAVGAGGANAGAGYVTLGGPPCDVTFSNTGGPTDPNPNSITINNLVEDPFDLDCANVDIQNPATSFGVSFAGNGTLTGSGLVRIRLNGGGITCYYESTSFSGTNSASTAVINGTFTRASGSSFLCPTSVSPGLLSVTSF